MKRSATLLFATLCGVAHAQPVDPYAETPPAAPVDPYAEPAKPEKGKPKGKTKKPEQAAEPGVIDPYSDRGAGVGMKPPPTPPPDRDVLLERKPGGGLTPIAPPQPPPTPPTGTGAAGVAVTEVELTGRFDLAAVQGLLAVQNLDGWLIVDHSGQNPVARSLVAVQGNSSRRWFYLVPRAGEPTVLCHASEVASFGNVPGMKITYTGYRDLDKILRAMLKGKKSLAMEYSPKGSLPSLSRVDAGTIELVRAAGVTVKSSDGLVQFAKATWGPEGRKKHYIAAHHLVELRKDAIGYIGNKLAAGSHVTEREVQTRLEKGMTTRGLVGPAPVVAFGTNTADPEYVPSTSRSAMLAHGDVIMISLAGKIDGGVFAAHTWVAVADTSVAPKVQVAFETAAKARDEALAFVSDRVKRRRAVKGWEVDKAARDTVTRAGMNDRLLHRTGHSLDSDLYGSGTDLDDMEVKDQRSLVVGTGFTVGPGVYAAGELGVRAEVSAYLGKDGLEVTTPAQESVETLLKQ
jgi:Xaa-Pro aminopeptidase